MAIYDTVQKVIDEVDLTFPNPFTDANKINWLNEVLLENYQWILEEKTTTIATVEDQAEYDLPTDCRFDSIRKVKVDDVVYYPSENDGYSYLKTQRYYESDEGKLGINLPPGESGLDIFLKYRQVVQVASVSDSIPFVEGTGMVAIYWLKIKAAHATQDDASANNFTIKYNDALQSAKLKATRGVKPHRTRDVTRRIGRGIK